MEKPFLRTCPNCNNIINYKRKDVLKQAIKNNTVCSKCAKKMRPTPNLKYLNEQIINQVLEIYFDEKKTLKQIASECNIKFDTLQKIISLKNLPKIKRVIKDFNRNLSYKKMFKTKFGLEYDEYLEKRPEYLRYKGRVKYYTNKTIKKWGVLIGDISKVKKGKNGYHVDHIVSIKDCYLANIEPYIVADIINLRVIKSSENLSKGANSLFSPDILKTNVLECENNKINLNELINGILYK